MFTVVFLSNYIALIQEQNPVNLVSQEVKTDRAPPPEKNAEIPQDNALNPPNPERM
jgi:hypothetical protein